MSILTEFAFDLNGVPDMGLGHGLAKTHGSIDPGPGSKAEAH